MTLGVDCGNIRGKSVQESHSASGVRLHRTPRRTVLRLFVDLILEIEIVSCGHRLALSLHRLRLALALKAGHDVVEVEQMMSQVGTVLS